jgi:selenocysteine-specific elongation factor
VTTGIQTQTAESIVIGEILSDKLIVVLNKIDLLDKEYAKKGEGERDKKLAKIIKKVQKVMGATKFGVDVPMVQVSANPGGGDGNLQSSSSSTTSSPSSGASAVVQPLLDLLTSSLRVPARPLAQNKDRFYFAIDHCFALKGKGTVLTGTVLSGCIDVGDKLSLPALGVEKKVKSIQMFRKPVQHIAQGDRAGVLVTDLDAKLLERGIASSPGMVTTCQWAIAKVEKVRFFKQAVASKSKLHITVGHSTNVASLLFFSAPSAAAAAAATSDGNNTAEEGREGKEKTPSEVRDAFLSRDYRYEEVLPASSDAGDRDFYALLAFEQPLLCARNSVIIGSKLDSDAKANACRLAMHGSLMCPLTGFDAPEEREKLKVYKTKTRTGLVDRVPGSQSLICKDMFAKETDMKTWTGLTVKVVSPATAENGAEATQLGTITGRFGKGAKFKVDLREPLHNYTPAMSKAKSGGGKGIKIVLEMRKFVHAREKKALTQPAYDDL